VKHVLSYGGGVNSSAMFFLILERKLPLDVVVFADTGEEETTAYASVAQMKIECEKRGIPFVTVKKDGPGLYDYYFEKKVVPSIKYRDCTGKFKVYPIRKYLRATYEKGETFVMYIGIAVDEAQRASDSDVKYIKNRFLFLEKPAQTRQDNIDLIKKHSFAAEKSVCRGCPFLGKMGFARLLKNDPAEYARWELLEENGSRFPGISLLQKGSLRALRMGLKEQMSLADFDDGLDGSETCGMTQGGCFL